jgi:hypothetical protein
MEQALIDMQVSLYHEFYTEGIQRGMMLVHQYFMERQPPRRHSVDRTNSSRKRAGGRRNKKLHNVRTFKSDWKGAR